MIESVLRPRWLWVSIAIGAYASSIAVGRTPLAAAARAAPALLLGLAWWILSGPPNRWLIAFLCSAVLLPPLPVALGDSGPHPCLAVAALGLVAGLLRLDGWRVPADGLSRAIHLLFFVLLASSALAAFYSGPVIAAATLAGFFLFGISV
jgi:hypothetical protein